MSPAGDFVARGSNRTARKNGCDARLCPVLAILDASESEQQRFRDPMYRHRLVPSLYARRRERQLAAGVLATT
jgi:hypothetical protein